MHTRLISLGFALAVSTSWAESLSIPVPLTPIRAGQTITAEALTTQTLPPRQVFASTVQNPAQVVGRVAARVLPAGQPINTLHVQPPSAVARDSAVRLVYARPGLELSASGKALENGQVGQVVRVLNLATKATLAGTVKAPGVVAVN